MNGKKFCMECGGELIISADGGVAICTKCGKSYTIIATNITHDTTLTTSNVYEERKNKARSLFNLGKKEDAMAEARKYLKEFPHDYRAYTLFCSIKLDFYNLNPVDAVIEQSWWEVRDKLLDGIKVASKEEYALMKAECGEYCKQAENVVQVFYDMTEFEKGPLTKPIAPTDPEVEISLLKNSYLEELAVKEKRLEELNEQYELVSREDKISEINSKPLPTGFFAKRKEMKKREKISIEIVREKGFRLQAIINEREECKNATSALRLKIAECEKRLEREKPKYLEDLTIYEKDLERYEKETSQYSEKEVFFKTDVVALAIKDKLEWVKEQIAECEKELAKLDKQTVEISTTSTNIADYYLTKAINRNYEQELTSKKLKLTFRIDNLKYMFKAIKPKPPVFKD